MKTNKFVISNGKGTYLREINLFRQKEERPEFHVVKKFEDATFYVIGDSLSQAVFNARYYIHESFGPMEVRCISSKVAI